jgi:1-acyl-sn-glycerol-3-phosphate acyltransferase
VCGEHRLKAEAGMISDTANLIMHHVSITVLEIHAHTQSFDSGCSLCYMFSAWHFRIIWGNAGMSAVKIKETPVLYRFVWRVIKWSLSLFFARIGVRHGLNIPTSGPTVFVANHPSSTMDGLVLTTLTRRVVHYIGHAGLFKHRAKAWFLSSCGMIPVHRCPGEDEKRKSNIEAFQACYEALEKGGAISIFPEGISEEARHVHKLKTGAARIILEAERRNNYQLGVQVIPIGLNFFSRSRFRSKVLVNVGRPLELAPYLAGNEEDNIKAVKDLTTEIQRRLEDLTVNIPHPELELMVKDLETVYRGELIKELRAEKHSTPPEVMEFVISQRMAECCEYYYERQPERVRRTHRMIQEYLRKLKRFHLKDVMLRERTSLGQLLKKEIVNMGKTIVGFPLAVYGIVNNYLPYRITEQIARKFIQERTKILTALLLGGGLTFMVFHVVQTLIVWYFAGILWSIIYYISLPLSGFFALTYTRWIREERERISFSFYLFTKRHLIGKMRLARRELISELDTIKSEYLQIMETASG